MPQHESHSLQSDFEFIGRLRDAELEAETIVSAARSDADRSAATARAASAAHLNKIRSQAAISRQDKIRIAEEEARDILHQAQAMATEEAGRIGQQISERDADIVISVAERIVDKHAHR